MIVKRIMPAARKRLVTVGADAPLLEAAILLGRTGVSLVVVCNGEGLIAGVLTKTDLVRHMSRCHGHACADAASSIMTRDITSCNPNDLLRAVWTLMKQDHRTHIPVVEDTGRPAGILNAKDVIEALMSEVEIEESLLRDCVMSVGYQ